MAKRIIESILTARSKFGASVVRQLIEIVYFRFRKRSQIGISEYFDFSLFDSNKYSFREKLEFCGYRLKNTIDSATNSRSSGILSQDKLIFYTLADNIGISVPELYGVFSINDRAVYTGSSLSTRQELSDFLIHDVDYPLFAKPIHSWHGIGGYGIARIDKDREHFVFTNGDCKSFDDFFDLVVEDKSGYIFQSLVTPHRETNDLSGGRVCSLRCVVFRVGAEFKIHRVVWKIAVGDNMADNFKHGESGNVLAKIDPETGAVERAFHNFGIHQVEASIHPDTGTSFENFKIPLWPQVKDSLAHASRGFPATRLQAWDVVVTDDGPLFLEMSVPMDLDIAQLGSEKGFCDVDYYKFIDQIERDSSR